MSFFKKIIFSEDCNVISVDWRKLAGTSFYGEASNNTYKTGIHSANFISFLVEDCGANYNDFHPIGFSLGAHVVGSLGAHLVNQSHTLPRITGLDPAGQRK